MVAGTKFLIMATICSSAMAGMAARNAHATKTYFIDEVTDYTGNGCGNNSDLNTVTSSLQTALNNTSWSGDRYTNGDSWPQDWWENCSSNYGSSGLDSTYADTKVLAVFAGHAARRTLPFGYVHDGACSTNLTDNARLGSMNGATAGFGMWLGCEVLNSDDLTTNMHQSLRQQAGWENVISIGDNDPRDFYNATNTKTNADAWLDEMADSSRRAIIATFSRSSGSDCWSKHNSGKLRNDVNNSAMGGGASCGNGQPTYWACSEERQ